MIPKKIHYCWFGRNPLPAFSRHCIESWKEKCPDYEIVEWNEDKFDVDSCNFTKEAYAAKKYAFVSDYVRLFALKNEGGIYLDTDVEVLKSFDPLLNDCAFAGFEETISISTAVMASEKNGKWICDVLNYYKDRHFCTKDGVLDLTTNVVIITKYLKSNGALLNNKRQTISGLITLYPKDWFSPKSPYTGIIKQTSNSFSIHHFSDSWGDNNLLNKFKKVIHYLLTMVVGEKGHDFIIYLIRKITTN